MILLRQKLYNDRSGRFWAGTKGALKGAGKGALWGAVLAPGKIIAARHDKWKLAAGITGAGALIGAGIGAKSGWKSGINDYKYNNDPEYRAKIDKGNKERALKALEYAKSTDELYISEMNYQGWINLSKEMPVPEEFMKYLKFYNSYWAKKVDFWYSNMNPEVYKDEFIIPEFKEIFPTPVDPNLAKEWYEDSWLCLATSNDAGDDGWVCYSSEWKRYGWDRPDQYDSLKELLLKHLERKQEYKIYSPAQKKLIEEFKNKIKTLL